MDAASEEFREAHAGMGSERGLVGLFQRWGAREIHCRTRMARDSFFTEMNQSAGGLGSGWVRMGTRWALSRGREVLPSRKGRVRWVIS